MLHESERSTCAKNVEGFEKKKTIFYPSKPEPQLWRDEGFSSMRSMRSTK